MHGGPSGGERPWRDGEAGCLLWPRTGTPHQARRAAAKPLRNGTLVWRVLALFPPTPPAHAPPASIRRCASGVSSEAGVIRRPPGGGEPTGALQRLQELGMADALAERLGAGPPPASSAVWLVADDASLAGVLRLRRPCGGTAPQTSLGG
jgi:hypothetical protein